MTKEHVLRKMPNPDSTLLATAVVGGAGLRMPPNIQPPDGMAAVVLFVPFEKMTGKNVMDIQTDLGLPWYAEGQAPVWIEELT